MRIKITLSTLLLLTLPISGATATTQNHIHALGYIQGDLYLATHHGLFRYIDNKTGVPTGPEFDIMGMAINKDIIFASGHPSQEKSRKESVLLNSKNPVGLLVSKDEGKTWQIVSLEGKVDFHTLASADSKVIGVDSSTNTLHISNDLGKTWTKRLNSHYEDIAISAKTIYLVKNNKLYLTNDNFKTIKEDKRVVKVTQVEANNGKVYIVSNNKLQELTKKAVNTVYDFKQQTALLAVSDAKIAILTRKGVLTSNDSGKTFK
jgi:hypothetical protein